MSDYQGLYDDFLDDVDIDPVDDRRSELSYLFMQEVAAIAERKGLKAIDLAKKMAIGRSQVSRWLSGSSDLKLSTIAKFELALETPIVEVNRRRTTVHAKLGYDAAPPAAPKYIRYSGGLPPIAEPTFYGGGKAIPSYEESEPERSIDAGNTFYSMAA